MATPTTTTTTIEEEAYNVSPAEPIISSEGTTNGSRKIIHHVLILEHGICGNASELGYVSEACLREYNNSESSKTRNKENTSSSLLVHSAVCNEGRLSLDGIENGGLRLANEINNVIRGVAIDKQHTQNNDERVVTTIALSIVGNSMGGLYGRYALKYIKFYFTLQAAEVGSTNTTVAVDVLVVPNVFVTTATPHLGIKNMTYWKVPEFLEPVGAWMFGKSSNDLFRRRNNKINNANDTNNANNASNNANNANNYHDIIEQLAFDPEFIGPLSKFKRRIAYANAFSTDIAVTTATAAFLVVEENNNDDNNDDNKDPCCASILKSSINNNDNDIDNTPQDFNDDSRSSFIIEEGEESELLTESSHMFVSKQYSSICFDTANTAQYNNRSTSSLPRKSGSSPLSVSDMARNLDSLGWSKVFVDNRPHIPALWKRKRKSFDLFESSTTTTTTTTKSGDGGTSTRINSSSANNTDCYSSCELKRRFSTNGWDGNTLPFGHSFLVASSRDPVHRFLYKSARPFVDQVIAKKVMNEMLQF